MTWMKDTINSFYTDRTLPHNQWFALFRDDGLVDDYTWVHNVQRGEFRLHPGTLSQGCITLVHVTDFIVLRNALLRTQTVAIPNAGLRAFGSVEVIHAGGEKC